MKEQQGPVSIFQTSNNHQSRQQRASMVDERSAIGSGRKK